jgi:hypothetical protein
MLAIIKECSRTFRHYRYPSTEQRNPAFDGAAFIKNWSLHVGSTHRHYQTQELVLCWSTEGQHGERREQLREELESDLRNIGSVLAAVDRRDDAWNDAIDQANARHLANAGRA